MAFRGMGETQLFLNAGDVDNPAIAHQGDLDTGMFFDSVAPSISATVAGVENMACRGSIGAIAVKNIFTNNSSTAGSPALQFQRTDNGFYGINNQAFAATIEGIVGPAGFAIVSTVRTLIILPGGSTSVACVSASGDNDTGIHFNPGGVNTISVGTAGVQRTHWGASGEIVDAPALANSTGACRDTGAVQTTDATQTTLHTLTLADNTTYAVSVTVAGRDTAGTERCSYIRYVQAHRQGGGGATISAITTPFSVESDAGLDCTYTVSGNDLRVSITGKAGTTINWSGSIKYIGSE